MVTKSKYYMDRRLMQNTFGFAKSPFNKRKYKPGMHKSIKPFSTFYGRMLNQRQKLKAFYRNLKTKQLVNIINNAMVHKNYKEYIIKHLELRLDTILFRSGIIKTFGLARQLINHGHVKVDSVLIKSPSRLLSNNEVIGFSEEAKKIINENIGKIGRKVPNHIFVNQDKLIITINSDNLAKNENDVHFATKISIDDIIRSFKI